MRAIGCDISLWNGKVDFQKMLQAGASFVFIKASQNGPDPRFIENRNAARAAGIPWGAYHYIDWTVDIVKQAVTFCDQLKDDPGQLPPVADFEAPSPPSDARGKLWTFLQMVEKATGKVPMIYTGFYYWVENGTTAREWLKYPLWLAWYANEAVIKTPVPWTQWTFWQYKVGGDGPNWGSSGLNIDMDYFNGTVSDLLKYAAQPLPHPVICPTCGQAWPIVIPPPPVVTPPAPQFPQYKTVYAVNVRKEADSAAAVLGVMGADCVIVVDKQQGQYSHFLPISDKFPQGGWVYSAYLTKV
jgi:lysozyme